MKKLFVWFMKLSMMSKQRTLHQPYKAIFSLICIVFALFYLYLAGPPFLGNPGTGLRRGLFMLLVLTMVFMLYPATKKSIKQRPTLWDGFLIILTFVSFGYWIIYYNDLVMRTGVATTSDSIMGALAIILSFEATRRVMGWLLPILAAVFLLYGNLGQKMPHLLSHSGYSWERLAAEMFTQNAIFGIVLETTASYVVLFVVFGALLNNLGAGEFFVRFPYALTAGFRGGPAKSAVVASGMLGMISGSATANTVASGTFTIPLMKKAGYRAHVAGAIEPSASTGGMFMPPIMGAAVFIMAEMISVPYVEIMIASIVPAILYFFSVAMMAHFEALREDIKVVPKSERDNPWKLLKEGWYYLTPIFLVIYLMLTGMTPARSVFWTIIVLMVIAIIARLIQKEKAESSISIFKRTGKDIIDGLEEGSNNSLVIGAVVGTVGVILGIVFLTGLGFIFTTSIMELTYGYVALGVLFAFIASYILGMGMTVTSAYILMAVLVAPAIQAMGVSALAAHLLVFWYSQTSNISPPVSMAAFAGSAIAKSDPIKTGFTALKYSIFLLIIPLLFVYSPILMPDGLTANAIQTIITAFIAVIPMASALSGFLARKTNIVERLLLFISAVMLIIPKLYIAIIGLVLFILIYITQKIKIQKKVATTPTMMD
ncbi:TRAP transporter permease [Salirhabdus salicampi]|uniref:TRAP transporter permease n=1 Tax=Salirhabdus salicampi TaxID=476102 RepID=UPI0020C2C804|nr:TRAP transporter permease [Salirhabdus salicampi]MCP8615917.1 TRAP transporter permease [Salirhabdus salicampi]